MDIGKANIVSHFIAYVILSSRSYTTHFVLPFQVSSFSSLVGSEPLAPLQFFQFGFLQGWATIQKPNFYLRAVLPFSISSPHFWFCPKAGQVRGRKKSQGLS